MSGAPSGPIITPVQREPDMIVSTRVLMPAQRSLAMAGLVLAVVLTGPAAAQTRMPAPPPAFKALLDCRQLTDAAARLACFDEKAATLDAATQSRDVVVTDRQAIKEARRGLFGFSLPKLALFGGGDDDDEEEVDEMTATVQSAWMAGNRMKMRLDNGAVWQQVGTDMPRRFPASGMKADLKRATLGTFFVRFDGQRAIRMTRVE